MNQRVPVSYSEYSFLTKWVHPMKSLIRYIVAAQTYTVIAALMMATAQGGDDDEIARGKYLVAIATCGNCHTPGVFADNPDLTRFLGGSDTAFEVPTVGAFVGGNITPDQETGIGSWSIEQIATTLQTETRPDGSPLPPGIHSKGYTLISKEDLTAIAMYLKSIPAVKNKVPGPFNPGDKVTTSLMRQLPPGEKAQ
jgi:mono/diheme cytochrome c family protein